MTASTGPRRMAASSDAVVSATRAARYCGASAAVSGVSGMSRSSTEPNSGTYGSSSGAWRSTAARNVLETSAAEASVGSGSASRSRQPIVAYGVATS